MHARLDNPLNTWGRFSDRPDGDTIIPGRLCYEPSEGIRLELVRSPTGITFLSESEEEPEFTLYGRLIDGTPVTLYECFVLKSTVGMGADCVMPTDLRVNRALFGAHIPNLDGSFIRGYSVRLSSLANWTCMSPLDYRLPVESEGRVHLNIAYQEPIPIRVSVAEKACCVEIGHGVESQRARCSVNIECPAFIRILPHTSFTLVVASELARQCQNLMSLLTGYVLSMQMICIEPAASDVDGKARTVCTLLFCQRGKHDRSDVHPASMLLPYTQVAEVFPSMVQQWLTRSKQAIVASNLFFGAQQSEAVSLNVKLLVMVQAAESYHRSLGTGLYMDQKRYDVAIEEFVRQIPSIIQEDHRQSLTSRLKYGNEYALRKRLVRLFRRLPQEVATQIAGNVDVFVKRIVDTRNYYTHYDHMLEAKALTGMDAYIAAERVRFLLVANLLHDLKVPDPKLLSVLQRNQEFRHYTSRDLSL